MSEEIEDKKQPHNDRKVSMLYVGYEKYKDLNLLELHAVLEYIKTPEGEKFAKDVRRKELDEIGYLETTNFQEDALDENYTMEVSMLESIIETYDMSFQQEITFDENLKPVNTNRVTSYYFYGEMVISDRSEKKKIYIEKESRVKLETEIIRQASDFGALHMASLPIEYMSGVDTQGKQVYVELIKSNAFRDEESFFDYWDVYMHGLGRGKIF